MDKRVEQTMSGEKNDQKPNDSLKGLGWISLICAILTYVVFFFGGHIFLATHNANMPVALIFLLLLFGWTTAFVAIGNREYGPAIWGIVLSLPAVILFIWFVCCFVVPFYVQWIKGGWYSIP